MMSKFDIVLRLRDIFKPREMFLRDGAALKRIQISSRAQMGAASLGVVATLGFGLTAVQFSTGVSAASTALSGVSTHYAQVAKMEARVSALQAEVAKIREGAKLHAAKLDQRDALLSAIIAGKGDVNKLAALELTDAPRAQTRLANDVRAPLAAVEAKQLALASQAQAMLDAKAHAAAQVIGHLGLASARFNLVKGGMGGPYEPVDEKAVTSGSGSFRSLFQSWKKLDQLQQGVVAIPAIHPVDSMNFTSNFGVRSDPFNGHRAMHAGVDIPGVHGSNIYATADGVVNRAEWVNGYGNLVELDHGRGIMTRYGHLSAFVVAPGTHVKRGQLIARMGSTGRSTGTHLHYEVRIDGSAVNPVPFLQSTDYLVALQKTPAPAKVAVGGPESAD
jgi:murein DD-endopeptidase MepM/ murein hydrolase activator NlpD